VEGGVASVSQVYTPPTPPKKKWAHLIPTALITASHVISSPSVHLTFVTRAAAPTAREVGSANLKSDTRLPYATRTPDCPSCLAQGAKMASEAEARNLCTLFKNLLYNNI